MGACLATGPRKRLLRRIVSDRSRDHDDAVTERDREDFAGAEARERPPVPRGFLTLLILVVALGPLALSSFVPALPTIARDFVVDEGVAQLALSLSMMSIAFTTLLYGPLSDRFGRRPVLIGTFAMGMVGSALGWAAQDMAGLILARVVQAAGIASGMVVARAIVQDVYGSERMASVMGNITGAMVIAPLAGPIIGGLLVEAVSWRAVFAMITLLGAATVVLMLWRLPETNQTPTSVFSAASVRRDLATLLKNRDFLRFSLYVVLAQSGLLTFIGGAPLIVEGVYGHPASAYGLYVSIMALGYMIGSLGAGRLGSVLARGGMMWIGTSLSIIGLGLALVLAAAEVPDLFYLSWTIALGAVGVGFALPAAQSGFIAAAPRIPGSASSLSGFLQMMMLAVSTQFVGLVQEADTAVPTVATMFAMVALAPVALWLVQPRHPQAPAFLKSAAFAHRP